jgi:hypothetical protein
VKLLDVVERKFGNMLWILCAGETDGGLCGIRRVEERDIVCVLTQSAEVGGHRG